jgi:hypothetical protein
MRGYIYNKVLSSHGVARQVSAIRLQRVRQLLGLPAAAPGPARPAQVRLAVYMAVHMEYRCSAEQLCSGGISRLAAITY